MLVLMWDRGAIRLGIVRQQVGGAHDLAGLAIAALRHPLGEPCLLDRMRGIRRQALDGGHGLAGHLRHLGLAREGSLAVDMHRAGAAQAGAASELGAGELEFLADHPQQRRLGRRIGMRRLAVDLKIECHWLLRGAGFARE
jgi:hypothetical protein